MRVVAKVHRTLCRLLTYAALCCASSFLWSQCGPSGRLDLSGHSSEKMARGQAECQQFSPRQDRTPLHSLFAPHHQFQAVMPGLRQVAPGLRSYTSRPMAASGSSGHPPQEVWRNGTSPRQPAGGACAALRGQAGPDGTGQQLYRSAPHQCVLRQLESRGQPIGKAFARHAGGGVSNPPRPGRAEPVRGEKGTSSTPSGGCYSGPGYRPAAPDYQGPDRCRGTRPGDEGGSSTSRTSLANGHRGGPTCHPGGTTNSDSYCRSRTTCGGAPSPSGRGTDSSPFWTDSVPANGRPQCPADLQCRPHPGCQLASYASGAPSQRATGTSGTCASRAWPSCPPCLAAVSDRDSSAQSDPSMPGGSPGPVCPSQAQAAAQRRPGRLCLYLQAKQSLLGPTLQSGCLEVHRSGQDSARQAQYESPCSTSPLGVPYSTCWLPPTHGLQPGRSGASFLTLCCAELSDGTTSCQTELKHDRLHDHKSTGWAPQKMHSYCIQCLHLVILMGFFDKGRTWNLFSVYVMCPPLFIPTNGIAQTLRLLSFTPPFLGSSPSHPPLRERGALTKAPSSSFASSPALALTISTFWAQFSSAGPMSGRCGTCPWLARHRPPAVAQHPSRQRRSLHPARGQRIGEADHPGPPSQTQSSVSEGPPLDDAVHNTPSDTLPASNVPADPTPLQDAIIMVRIMQVAGQIWLLAVVGWQRPVQKPTPGPRHTSFCATRMAAYV